jgi:hypothetical protein
MANFPVSLSPGLLVCSTAASYSETGAANFAFD